MEKHPQTIKQIHKTQGLEAITKAELKYIEKLFEYTPKREEWFQNVFISQCKSLLNEREFIIQPENDRKMVELLCYFSGNGNLDLRKGIFLFGNYGNGKTIFMESIRKSLDYISRYLNRDEFGKPINPNSFMSASIESIIEHFKKEGDLSKYGFSEKKHHLCIHEFGKKLNEKIYGTDANSIIESLFMIRYELYQKGYLTHVTSNYNPLKIDIPDILKDRMVEMFNFIEFKGKSLRT